jgi:hypothetical protein
MRTTERLFAKRAFFVGHTLCFRKKWGNFVTAYERGLFMKSAFRFLVPLCFLVGVGCADSDAVISGSLSQDSFSVLQEAGWESSAGLSYCEDEAYANEPTCHLAEDVAELYQ